MSVATTTGPNPGWYPDPHSPAQLRWWNGAGWTESTQELPRGAASAPTPAPEPVAHEPAFFASTRDPELAFVASTLETQHVPRPAAFDTSFVRDATTFVLELPEEDLGPAGPPPVRFSFRSRAAQDLADELESLLYVSPLAATKSPLRDAEAQPAAKTVEEPVVEDDEDFEVVDAELVDDADEPVAAAAPPRWAEAGERLGIDLTQLRRPGRKTAIVAVAAASAALLTNVLHSGSDHPTAAKAKPAVALAAKDCLKLWNTADSAAASSQRITLGQFAGALARVGHVDPLAGTLMQPDSCGLTVYQPGTDTSAVFVAGVKDQVGYLDVTAYPRAAKQYGWPKTPAQANVSIQADGTLIAKG
ncbi:MAG: hypothetical protein QOF76_3159 [Solirubrobacteraceae bacterium]|nr:hypothetical protein [Solirubrobacteraceae bacterium]